MKISSIGFISAISTPHFKHRDALINNQVGQDMLHSVISVGIGLSSPAASELNAFDHTDSVQSASLQQKLPTYDT